MPTISPFLWFDDAAEEAAALYVSLFDNSSIVSVARYPEGAAELAGTVMSVTMVLDGLQVMALNGGPQVHFSEAVSFFVTVDGQEEIDRLWKGLIADGGSGGQCGWLKDRFGMSWQIVPAVLATLLADTDAERSGRVLQAMYGMSKLDIIALCAAHDGQ